MWLAIPTVAKLNKEKQWVVSLKILDGLYRSPTSDVMLFLGRLSKLIQMVNKRYETHYTTGDIKCNVLIR